MGVWHGRVKAEVRVALSGAANGRTGAAAALAGEVDCDDADT